MGGWLNFLYRLRCFLGEKMNQKVIFVIYVEKIVIVHLSS